MDAPRVTVHASAERKVPPDSFTVSAAVAGVESDARSARAALVARFAELERVVADLPDSIEIRPGELTSWPEGGRRQQRWWVRRAMTLIGHDVTTVADVAAAVARATEVEVDGPRWGLDRSNAVHGELQADVVQQARERAERYAVALGGTLGRLVELRDPEGAFAAFAGEAVPLALAVGGGPDIGDLDFSPELMTVRASVVATWTLVLPE